VLYFNLDPILPSIILTFLKKSNFRYFYFGYDEMYIPILFSGGGSRIGVRVRPTWLKGGGCDFDNSVADYRCGMFLFLLLF